MRNRQLLYGTLGSIAIYWISGLFIPNPYLSSAASFAILLFGFITFLKYAPASWDVLFHDKKLNNSGDGSHLAVMGITLLAAGSVYSGLFGLLWVFAGQPSYWLGTPFSGFGRAVAAGGFWLMYASPDVIRKDMRVPGLAWLIVIVAASVLTGIFLGSQLEIK